MTLLAYLDPNTGKWLARTWPNMRLSHHVESLMLAFQLPCELPAASCLDLLLTSTQYWFQTHIACLYIATCQLLFGYEIHIACRNGTSPGRGHRPVHEAAWLDMWQDPWSWYCHCKWIAGMNLLLRHLSFTVGRCQLPRLMSIVVSWQLLRWHLDGSWSKGATSHTIYICCRS